MTDTTDMSPIRGPVRTRFAPSPTGRLHLGNVRIAVFNWLFTRRHGGAFILRVEDTDTDRNVEGAEAGIVEDLRWLGLEPDEGPELGGDFGPYRQSERGADYRRTLDELRSSGAVYPCFCPEGDETEDRRYAGTCRAIDPSTAQSRVDAGESHVFRFRVPEVEEVGVVDRIRGRIAFPRDDIDDFVVARSDGRPTYNFAVVVDDIAMEITDVIRGAGHLPNTPKQQLIFEALGRETPRFAHLPTVLAPDGGKLSKRSGAAAVADLRERGVPPGAVVNYLSLLGWSHPEEKEILTAEELIAAVDLDRARASDTQYDPEKFAWVAQQHLAALPDEAYLAEARARVDRDRYPLDDGPLDTALLAIRSRLKELGEIPGHLTWVIPEEGPSWEALRDRVRNAPESAAVCAAARNALAELDTWSAQEIKGALREAGREAGVRGAGLFVPIRMAVTADEHGPEIGALLEAAGKSAVLARLDAIGASGGV